jgi:alkanesulfonate monooxygenase SsuD/methylene tetrahydromethanopterin reductase-like flavin-dependent oxidoreductase (luciferase family)
MLARHADRARRAALSVSSIEPARVRAGVRAWTLRRERVVKIGVIGRLDGPAAGPASEASGETGVIARLVSAEAQGYAAAWLCGNAHSEAALLMSAAQLAVRTEHIALGVVGALAGILHPIRVAEDLAVLDLMCAGRLSWALPTRLDGSPDDEGLREAIEIVRRAWSGRTFSHAGPRYAVPELVCHPAPARAGGPALYTAAPDAGGATAFVASEGEATAHPQVLVVSVICEADEAAARVRANGALLAGGPEWIRDGIEAMIADLPGDPLVLIDPAPPGVDDESAARSQRGLAEALFG